MIFAAAEILGSETGSNENNKVIAGTINNLSSSSLGASSGFAVASSGKIVGTTEKKASEKNTLSESNKGTRIKTGNKFNFGGLNLQSHQIGASRLSSIFFDKILLCLNVHNIRVFKFFLIYRF